eukprot:43095_1
MSTKLLDSSYQIVLFLNIIIIISCIHNFILFIWHLYSIIFIKRQSKQNHTLHMLTILDILLWFFFPVVNILLIFNYHTLNCRWIVTIAIGVYGLAKAVLYILLLERLYSIFTGTCYSFKPSQIWTFRIILAFYILIAESLAFIYGDGYFNDITHSCKALYPFWMNAMVAAMDFILCGIISVLFARKLLLSVLSTMEGNINNEQQENKTKNSNLKAVKQKYKTTWRLLRKSSILSMIVLFTTCFSLILMSLFGGTGMFACLDSMVNIWCIMLIWKVHRNMFNLCCGGLLPCITVRCLGCFSCNLCFPIEVKPELPGPMEKCRSVTQSVETIDIVTVDSCI